MPFWDWRYGATHRWWFLGAIAARRYGEAVHISGLSLSEQAAQKEVSRAWDRMLDSKLHLVKDGETVELSGRQVVGLHAAAERVNESQDGHVLDCILNAGAAFVVFEREADREFALRRFHEIEVQHEESNWMVADVLTKIMQPVVLFARRILARYVDGQFEF